MQLRALIRGGAALVAATAALAAATSAQAASEWRDGVSVQSTLYNPCLDITEVGALARAGYETDAAKTHPGDVFYGHALFGAATHVGGNCTDTDQAAELDVVLPPGVRLAIDAKHPVNCFYADGPSGSTADPSCPTKAVNGVYGPQFTHGDGGGPWDMPPGRLYEVQFPLVASRPLKGPAGGHCPQTLDELGISKQRDCLLLAVHVADGTDDPWLLPNEEMVIAPGASSAQPALKAAHSVKLGSLRAHGLKVSLTVPRAGATATVALEQGRRTLGKLVRKHLRKGRVGVRVRLSKGARAGKLTVTARLSRPKTTVRTSVTVKR